MNTPQLPVKILLCTRQNIFIADKKFLDFFFKRVKLNTSDRYDSEFPYVSPCGRETNYVRCDDLPVVFSQLLDSSGQPIEDIASLGNSKPSVSYEHLSPTDTTNTVESDREVYTGGGKGTSELRVPSKTASEDSPSDRATIHTESHAPHTNSAHHSPLRLAYGGTLTLTVPFQPSSLCMLPESGRLYHSGPEKLGGVGLVKSSLAIGLSQFFVYGEGEREGAQPLGFRWQGRTWTLDTSILPRPTKLTHNRT